MTKTCIKCSEVKPLDEYYPVFQGKHGRGTVCIECCKKRSKARRDRIKLESCK